MRQILLGALVASALIALAVGVTLTVSASRSAPPTTHATTQEAKPPPAATETSTQPQPAPSEARADDASAKVQARTMEVAAETLATDSNGSYRVVTLDTLERIEPTLKEHSYATPEVLSSSDEEYKLKSTDTATGNWFTITRNSNGVVTRECAREETGGCPAGGRW